METYEMPDGTTLTNVHPAIACEGRPCVIHNPSNHGMGDWPLNWRGDRSLMERLCSCGVGHPDPDHMAYELDRWGRVATINAGVHGCCGCCRGLYAAQSD